MVIIQFPDSSNRYIEEVESYLEERGYSYDNGFVAKWLSEDKINIAGIEKPNATPVFLLWKQALSTGWDCPRAKILVKLRDNGQKLLQEVIIGNLLGNFSKRGDLMARKIFSILLDLNHFVQLIRRQMIWCVFLRKIRMSCP